MEISVTQEKECVLFTVTGEIGEKEAEALRKCFIELDRSSVSEIIFDFSTVTHIGSSGIGKLLLFNKELSVCGGSIRIENVSEMVYDLFRLLKLDTILSVSRAGKEV
ncbi:STAS domain-containing protein [Desulfococcaceae bacterium HSG8]|nr:STAS domain-containing protein [Desulfococcaceae bacterium HSG8]